MGVFIRRNYVEWFVTVEEVFACLIFLLFSFELKCLMIEVLGSLRTVKCVCRLILAVSIDFEGVGLRFKWTRSILLELFFRRWGINHCHLIYCDVLYSYVLIYDVLRLSSVLWCESILPLLRSRYFWLLTLRDFWLKIGFAVWLVLATSQFLSKSNNFRAVTISIFRIILRNFR